MIPAVGIVPVVLYLFSWNGNVLAVLSASCVDVAVNVLDLSRVAVRLVATANGRIVGHVPLCIKLFMQELILRRMVPRGLALSISRRISGNTDGAVGGNCSSDRYWMTSRNFVSETEVSFSDSPAIESLVIGGPFILSSL